MKPHALYSSPLLPLTAAMLLLGACRSTAKQDIEPPKPDYADATNWYTVNRNSAVDLFYITSTGTGDYNQEGHTMHYADISREEFRALLLDEMQGIDHMYSGSLNFFSPHYRQCTLETFADDSLIEARIPLAMSDVRSAFQHYLKHSNNGRPFILMGFSQGACAVVELLKTMDDEAYSRMAAAYVVGWKVTDKDLGATEHIRPAQDSADLGVTICYNSVRSVECAVPILTQGNRLVINPVNWRTDTAPAMVVDRGDTLIVTIDTATRMLIVDGYRRNDYMLPLIGREGNYHRLDITLYRESLQRNIALRARRSAATPKTKSAFPQ